MSVPPELLEQMAAAGMAPEQLQLLQPRLRLAQQFMEPQFAQGRQVGGTYVAASPLEHLSNAIRQIIGGKMAGDVRRQQQAILEQQQKARSGFAGAVNTAQQGGQGGTLGMEGGGMARPPDPQAAQQMMMAGAGSGDPAIQAMSHFGMQQEQLGRQNRILENTLRHQQVLEGQGQGRLDLGQERIDAMNQALALRGIRYDPNTSQFVDIRPMAGVPRPGHKPALPRSTGNAAPAAPPAAPPSGGGGGAPPPGGDSPPLPMGKWQDAALKALGKDFDPSNAHGEYGRNYSRTQAAKRVMALAEDENGNARDLSPQQMPELAQSVASLIGGSSAAQAQIEHLLPHTFTKDAAGILQYLTAEPHGSGQQAFVKQFLETAKREQGVAQQGVEDTRKLLGTKHQRILQWDQGRPAKKVLNSVGWDIGPDGVPVLKQAEAPKGATDTAALRKKYGL